jgi:hypothetical protein
MAVQTHIDGPGALGSSWSSHISPLVGLFFTWFFLCLFCLIASVHAENLLLGNLSSRLPRTSVQLLFSWCIKSGQYLFLCSPTSQVADQLRNRLSLVLEPTPSAITCYEVWKKTPGLYLTRSSRDGLRRGVSMASW